MADTNPQSTNDSANKLDAKLEGLINQFTAQMKKSLRARIQRMVAEGKVGKAVAEGNLLPQVEGLAMSLDDFDSEGKPGLTPLEMALDMLDANPALTTSAEDPAPVAGRVPQQPADMDPNQNVLMHGFDRHNQPLEDEEQRALDAMLDAAIGRPQTF